METSGADKDDGPTAFAHAIGRTIVAATQTSSTWHSCVCLHHRGGAMLGTLAMCAAALAMRRVRARIRTTTADKPSSNN